MERELQLRFPGGPAVSRCRTVLPLLALGAALVGCSEGREPLAPGSEHSAVIGGVPSGPAFDGVVAVYAPTTACSGSLIAPNVVMTALHCIVQKSSEEFTCNEDGTASMGGELGDLLPPDQVYIYTGPGPDLTTLRATGKRLFGTGSMSACKWDIGLIVLDHDVDAPLIPLRFGRATEPGDETSVIGYGYIDDNKTVLGRQQRDNVGVLYVGADFWHPANQFAAPDTIVVGEGPCHGDSGSPLLSMETGAAIGVSSVGFSSCQGLGVQSAYTEVASFEATIREALTYAGHDPVLEQTGSGGDAGATGQGGEATIGEGGATATGGGTALGGTGGSSAGNGSGNHAGVTNGRAGSAGGTNASAGAAASGDDPGVIDGGSGSRRDPACTCRAAGSYRDSRSLSAVLALALGLAARRRSRRA